MSLTAGKDTFRPLLDGDPRRSWSTQACCSNNNPTECSSPGSPTACFIIQDTNTASHDSQWATEAAGDQKGQVAGSMQTAADPKTPRLRRSNPIDSTTLAGIATINIGISEDS